MIIDELITDRTAEDVALVISLALKGRAGTWTAAEATQYAGYLKGAYNLSDVNRVSTAEAYLGADFSGYVATLWDYRTAAIAAVLASLIFPEGYYNLDNPILPTALGQVDYTVPTLETVKTNWAQDDDLTPAALHYYIYNAGKLVAVLDTDADIPASLDGLDYVGANEIEAALVAVYNDLVAYKAEKEQAIDDAKDAAILKYHLQDASWWLSGETYAGEI